MSNPEKENEVKPGDDYYGDFYDTFGIEDSTWSPLKVKELLRDLIKSNFIFQVDEAVLYSFLLRKGLLNLHNRHDDFFRNLVRASRTKSGKEAIIDYANSESKFPPDTSRHTDYETDDEEKIETANTNEIHDATKDSDILDTEQFETIKQILSDTDVLEGEEKNSAEELLKDLQKYGIFIVPCGELEAWPKSLVGKNFAKDYEWLVKILGKLEETNPIPTESGVWKFFKNINTWVSNPERLGIDDVEESS